MDFWADLIAHRQEQMQDVDAVAMRQRLLRKQEGRCRWCKGIMEPFDRTLDHVIPHSLGGPYVQANLVLAHERCNERRGSRFSDHLLERLPDGVLALTIENLQTLAADAYEATSENQARVLELRRETENKLLTLLIQRMQTRQQQHEEAIEKIRTRQRLSREKIEKESKYRLGEKAFLNKQAQLRTGKIGKQIARYEKRKKIVRDVPKPQTIIRRPKNPAQGEL